MSSTPDWEKLFNERIFCSNCGENVTFDAGWCLDCGITTEEYDE